MDHSSETDDSQIDLQELAELITRGNCVLVLGPRVAIRANDPGRTPLDELLTRELLSKLPASKMEASLSGTNLRRAAELVYPRRQDRVKLQLAVKNFYAAEANATTDFHRDLAQLPFKLCVNASPDDLMFNAFQEAKKKPQNGYYSSFKQTTNTQLSLPTEEKPLVYHLFGHHADMMSLVLTEGDLIKFLVAIVRNGPPVPDQVRSILKDDDASFLFLGFGFQNWYLRVLLHVLEVYGHGKKAIALEDERFFEHPEHVQAVVFFSDDDRLVEFHPLHWDTFARQLREVYNAGAPQKMSPPFSTAESVAPNAPKAFISYASEDRAKVEVLAGELEAQGIRIWRDQTDLRAGDNWNQVLIEVIKRRVDYFIVVQTHAMTTQIDGVFHREIETALQKQIDMGYFEGKKLTFLVPVKIGNCTLLPPLRSSHVVDVGEPGGVDSVVNAIKEDWKKREALKSLLQGPS